MANLAAEANVQLIQFALDEDERCLEQFKAEARRGKRHPVQTFIRSQIAQDFERRLAAGQLRSQRLYCFINTPYPGQTETLLDANGRPYSPTKQINSWNALGQSVRMIAQKLLSLSQLVPGKRRPLDEDALAALIKKNADQSRSLTQQLAHCPGVQVRPCKAVHFFRVLRRTWSPAAWQAEKKFPGATWRMPAQPLRAGIAAYYATEDVEDWGWQWRVGRTYHRLLTMRTPPKACDLGFLVMPTLADRNWAISNRESVLTLLPAKANPQLQRLQKELNILEKQYRANPSKYAANQRLIEDKTEQIRKLSDRDATNAFHALYHIHLWHEDPEALDAWESGLQDAFKKPPLEATIAPEQFAALPYFMAWCTPGYTRSNDLERATFYTTDEVVTLLPLLGGGEQMASANPETRRVTLLTETSRGCPGIQDDFIEGKAYAYHGLTVGKTGGGKTTYYNRKALLLHSPFDDVFILDAAVAAGSYRSLCTVLSGRAGYIEIALHNPQTPCFNVTFTRLRADGSHEPPTDHEIQRMESVIEPMLREYHDRPLSSPHRGLLTRAIQMAFESRVDPRGRVYLRHIAQSFLDNFDGHAMAEVAKRFAAQLQDRWCHPRGTYRRFFDGDNTAVANGFVVFDLKALDKDDALKGVVSAAITAWIDHVVDENLARPAHLMHRLHVWYDEAWKTLRDPVMRANLESYYRAGRARGISVHCLSQQMSEFLRALGVDADDPDSVTASPIIGQSTWTNVFSCNEEDVTALQKVYGLSPAQADVIRSLAGQDTGQAYREMVQIARLSHGQSFKRYLVRPVAHELPLYTSTPRAIGEKNAIRHLLMEQEGWGADDLRPARQRAIAELKDGGVEDAETLSDEQLLEFQIAYVYATKRLEKRVKNLLEGDAQAA